MDAIKVYEKVLKREMKGFPWGYWRGEQGKKRAIKILKYLQQKSGVPLSEIPHKFTTRYLEKQKLAGLVTQVFQKSTKKMIQTTWPKKIQEWEIPYKNKWNGEKGKQLAVQATKNLFKKLGIPRKKVAEYASHNLFQDYGLSGMIKWAYQNSIYLAIKAAYPEYEWEDLIHNIRSGQKFKSNHGHIHNSMFQRRIDDYIGELKLKHEHNVKYPKSNLDCDIVIEKGNKKVWIECAGMMHLKKYLQKMQNKRKIAKEYGLKLIEIYLKDDWKQIKEKIRQVEELGYKV